MRTDRPQVGADYPRSLGEFQAWFASDADCLDYLEWLRWPDGFVCPHCGNPGGWRVADGSLKCAGCKAQTAVTAGTLFDRRRTPLTVWFAVCWQFATARDGVSALAVKRTLQIGSYQRAWAMLHRLRSVLVAPGRELLLSGTVEVDETYIGGEEAGLAGGRAKGKKALVVVAVEVTQPKGFGRCRMQIIPDASGKTLHGFITDPSRRGRSRSSAWIPQRVLFPVQPAPLEQPRAGVPARAATGRRPRSCLLHPTRRPSRAEEEAADATGPSGPSTQPGPATRRTPVAAHTVDESSRFRWIALTGQRAAPPAPHVRSDESKRTAIRRLRPTGTRSADPGGRGRQGGRLHR